MVGLCCAFGRRHAPPVQGGQPRCLADGAGWAATPPAGLIVLYNDDAPAPKLNVGYNSQPKMRASGQAGRRPAGVLGAWVRAARVVGHTKPPRPFSVEKTGSCYILYIR